MSGARDGGGDTNRLTSGSMEIVWDAASRLAILRFGTITELGKREASFLVESLGGWIGPEGKRFGLLADTRGVRGADAEYRARTRDFFRQHRRSACVAVTNMGPVIRIVAEMFRIGTGIQLKGFSDDAGARAWLRAQGIAA